MSMYDNKVASMHLTHLEYSNHAKLKYLIGVNSISKNALSVWGNLLELTNEDSYDLSEAPLNTFLVVVSACVGNLGSGQHITTGSVFIKLKSGLIYCVETYTWMGPSHMLRLNKSSGYLTYKTTRFNGLLPYGKVKELSNIKF